MRRQGTDSTGLGADSDRPARGPYCQPGDPWGVNAPDTTKVSFLQLTDQPNKRGQSMNKLMSALIASAFAVSLTAAAQNAPAPAPTPAPAPAAKSDSMSSSATEKKASKKTTKKK